MLTYQFKIIRRAFLLLSVLIANSTFSQVTINLNVLPPYSSFYRDYAGLTSNKVIVTLLYHSMTNGNSVQVFLSGSIRKDDNSVSVQLKDTYHPGLPFTLMPNIPQTLTGAQLHNLFGSGSSSDLILNGITSNDLVTNQALPEGNYTICAQVKDYNSGRVMGEDCRTVNVAHYEPPQIIKPFNNSTEIANYPQYLLMSWTPATPFVQGLNYRLRLVKLLPGVSPIDALNNSTQVIVEKSNIPTPNYNLDLGSGVKLDTGSMYVMQVTAYSPLAYFKNNGKSEPIVFYYKGGNNPISTTNTSGLTFLIPNSKIDTLKVNNESDLLINWNWLKKSTSLVSKVTLVDDSAVIKYNIAKYELNIMSMDKLKKSKNDGPTILKRVINKNKKGLIDSYVSMSANEADSIGFIDGNLYKATLTAYDDNDIQVSSVVSDKFTYSKMKDEVPMFNIPVQAVVKYSFKGFPEINSVSNTEVTVEALMLKVKQHPNSSGSINTGKIEEKNSTAPAVNIKNSEYVSLGKITGTTDSMGVFHAKVPIPQQYFSGSDSIYYRLRINNQYYVDKSFALQRSPKTKKDTIIVSFGQLVAQTYAFSLKLNVSKAYTSYNLTTDKNNLNVSLGDKSLDTNAAGSEYKESSNGSTTMSYYVEKRTMAAGIPIVLYRKSKQDYIPPVEGDLLPNSKPAQSKITVIAYGVTQKEKDSTYVKFDKLLSSVFSNDEYFIMAFASPKENSSDAIKKNSAIEMPELNSNTSQKASKNTSGTQYTNLTGTSYTENSLMTDLQSAMKETNLNMSNKNAVNLGSLSSYSTYDQKTVYADTGYVAQEQLFKLPLPSNTESEDALYRNVNASYQIVSAKPPTSMVKGRLYYVWKSDGKKQLRPLANADFKIVVDYLADGKSIGSLTKVKGGGGGFSVNTQFFVPDGKDEYSDGMQLMDQYATMAVGKTDNQGNFQIEVANINQKGSLGSGNMASKGWSYNPNQETTKPGGFNPGDIMGDLLDKVTNPGDQLGFAGALGNQMGNQQTQGTQGLINGGNVSFTGGVFEVGKSTFGAKTGGMVTGQMQNAPIDNFSGPCPSELPPDDSQDATHVNKFSREYRIMPLDEAYFYPCKETFTVDAFNTKTDIISTSFVKEFKLKVQTQDKVNNSSLDGVRVTVFRDLNSKPKNLPLGEGDGKYKYATLLSPQYNSTNGTSDVSQANNLKADNVLTEKFEQIWPDSAVTSYGEVNFQSLLQAEAGNDYYVEACSQMNNGVRTYKATFDAVPAGNFDTADPDYWSGVNDIPEIPLQVKMQPLPSRAFLRVKDKSSDIPISGTPGLARVLVKDANSNYSLPTSYLADKDGYVELLATEAPLNNYAGTGKKASFSARAKGYKDSSEKAEATFDNVGSQFWYNFHLNPGAVLKGHIVCPDENGKGVGAYLQIGDSGKIMETSTTYSMTYINGNQTAKEGVLNSLPIANIAGTKIKIIPKDVAYFDSVYVLTAADENKSIIDLGNFNVYRRKHRLAFTIKPKQTTGGTNQYPQNPYVNGATIQLGDQVYKTDQYGKVNVEFENVSVDYTFVIKGPAGQGYIPKTLNVKNLESKNYVNQIVELEKGSEVSGKVTLDGKPVKHAKVYLDVVSTSSTLSASNLSVPQLPNSSSAGQQNYQLAGNNPQYTQPNTTINNGTSSTPTGSLTDDANLVVAYSDANGNYRLQGVPIDNQTINIIATLDTTFTVNGDNQKAIIKNKYAVTNLALTGFNKARINSIFGFPLTVEKITPVSDTRVKVSGLVQWKQAISNFNLEEINQVLRIDDVLFNLERQGTIMVGVPKDSTVNLEGITDLKLLYLNKYNVMLVPINSSNSYSLTPLQLAVTKENGYGKIKGKMCIVENSFNYPSTYLNFKGSEFYLATKGNNGISNNLSVVTSALTESESNISGTDINSLLNAVQSKRSTYKTKPQPTYNLSDKLGKSIKFKLIEFNAKADSAKSYIDLSGKIHLNTTLSCSIPNAQPSNFTVNIDDMVLDDYNVYPASSTSPINLSLENWTLKVKDWSFSAKEGGIVSSNALIQTSAIDIPVGEFVLRHDLFLMNKFKMDKLSMAGGKIVLEGIDPSNAHLNYDQKTGKDMKPHWSFGIVSNGDNPVASLPHLTDLGNPAIFGQVGNSAVNLPGENLKLNYIQMLSNNEIIFQLKQEGALKLRDNSLAMFSPQSIFNGPDYISISGSLNVGAPRMGNVPLIIKYTNPAQTMSLDSVSTDFEAPGFVHFIADKRVIFINKSIVKINGLVAEKPTPTFNPVPAKFIATVGGSPVYKVDMQKDWVMQLTSNSPGGSSSVGYSLKMDYGGLKVENGDWTTLKFGGLMSCNSNSTGSKPSYTNFEVLGDISANSDSLSVSNLSTPFGAMTQTFDFANKRLIGSIKINLPITLGIAQLNSGTIETCFDNSGFYVAGGCSSFLNAGLLAGTYNLGFMAGNYALTDHLWSVVNSYIDPSVVDECYRTDTKKEGGLKGVYFAVNRELLNASAGFDFILASGYVRAIALVGGDFYANFGSAWKMGGSGYAHLDVAAGLSSITGTSISGGLQGNAKIAFQVSDTDPHLTLNGSMDLGFNGEIKQSLVLTTISKSFSVSCSANYGTSGFGFSLNSGNARQTCP